MLRIALLLAFFTAFSIDDGRGGDTDFGPYGWNEVNTAASWTARAGLEAVELGDAFYILGGRTPIDPDIVPVFGASTIWGDVWKSVDRGESWSQVLDTNAPGHWAARAYFEAVTRDGQMFVLGGQDFNVITVPGPMGPQQVPVSNFFNDVWSSQDGVNWVQKTADAGWEGRAGLSSIVYRDELYVFGGSKNDDQSIIGPGGPARIYFNDVWKSSDEGATWQEVAAAADWEPRAGAAVVVKDDFIYLLGGEDGFTCDSGGSRCPPYFNDVWRTQDGQDWELVTAAADWTSRPGHVAGVVGNDIVVFGGFGLSNDPSDPFKPANPIDMWVSEDGVNWELLSATPWNASAPEQIKYDFDALFSSEGPSGAASIYTFGGDRETFNPLDPTNYLNVDNDVWRYSVVPEPTTSTMVLIAMFALWGGSAIRRT
jgi:hypothetical protein